MGSFNDLPKDVVWMIFKRVIIGFIEQNFGRHVLADASFSFSLSKLSNVWLMQSQMQALSLTSRPALTIIRTKCKKKDNHRWHFKTGALF